MKEDFLHYIWKLQLVTHKNLVCTDKKALIVLNQGQHNFDAGPDFFNAKIKIGNQIWAGNVEIHVKASDWYVHNHEVDSNYDAVILHVVWENDAQIFRKDNSVIPTLILKDFVPDAVLQNYRQLLSKSHNWINCENDISSIDDFLFNNWLERLYIERLEQKSALILELLETSKNDWEAVLFILLAKNFGLKVNGDAFLSFAKSIDFNVVRKVRQNQKDLEALLFGCANLLEDVVDNTYFSELKARYEYQKVKFKLKNTFHKKVQFFRLRPNNFPTIRLAQLAALYYKHHNLFSKINEVKNSKDFYTIFEIVTSDFWQTHYTFSAATKSKRNKKLSKSFIDLLLINTVMPLQFIYHKQHGKDKGDVIIEMMRQLKPEKNTIINHFNSLNIEAKSAFKTQALLQLKNNYCSKNKCVQCAIGNALLLHKNTSN